MKYFFNMRGENSSVEDPDGMELPDVLAVRQEALLDARLFVSDRIRAGDPIDAFRIIEVVDETGAVVYSLPVISVIDSAFPPGALEWRHFPQDQSLGEASG